MAYGDLGIPQVEALLEAGLQEGAIYLVYEKLERVRELQASDIPELFAAVLALHRRGTAHRDLRPENIVITSKGLKLANLGLVNAVRPDWEGVDFNPLIGCPAYLAPEQIRQRPLWKRNPAVEALADQYSLGVILYQLLTGRLPFPVQEPLDGLLGHLWAPPPLMPEASLPLEAVVLRMLSKEPQQRYPDLAAAWQAYSSMREEPISRPRGQELPARAAPAEVMQILRGSASESSESSVLLAPEEILAGLGGWSDERTPQYRVGLMAYRLLTGRDAFPDDSPIAVLKHRLRGAPAPSGLPSHVEEVLLRMLAADKRERFPQTALALETLDTELKRPAAELEQRNQRIARWKDPADRWQGTRVGRYRLTRKGRRGPLATYYEAVEDASLDSG